MIQVCNWYERGVFEDMNRASLTILLTVISSIAAVVACGPNNGGKVPIAPSPFGKKSKVIACLTKIGRHDIRVDSKTMTVDGIAPVLEICEAEPNVDYTPYTRTGVDAPPAPPVVYKRHRRDLGYRVGKVNDVVTIFLSVGIEFQGVEPRSGNDLEAPLKKVGIINNLCVSEIKKVWQASALGKVDLKITVDTFDYSNNYDQIFTLKGSTPEAGKSQRFIAVLWPDRGQFVPSPQVEQGCSGNCRAKALQEANQRFCANFAILVGQWLGLKAPETATESCTVPVKRRVVDIEHSPDEDAQEDFVEMDEWASDSQLGLSGKGSDYMKSADPKSPEFWKTLRFSRADLKTILEQACRGKTTAAKPVADKPTPEAPKEDDKD